MEKDLFRELPAIVSAHRALKEARGVLGTLNDEDITRIEVDICNRYRLRQISKADLRASIEAIARENSYDPVREYLRGLKWDGTPRIARAPEWLMHTKPSPLFSSIFRRWMIGAARRPLQPGTKMDNVLILVGPQGYRKSSFFKALAGDWHSDTAMDLNGKDVYQQLHRAWILEWSELASLRRLEQERVKAFVTSTHDTFRPPYGRSVVHKARAGVIVGTTNSERFLDDPTGSRRFWIIPIDRPIDVDTTIAARDQMWAEATQLALAGEQHWLTDEEEAARTELSRAFTTDDWIYQAAHDFLEYGPDQVSWSNLCNMIGVRVDVSGRQRESVSRALQDTGFENVRRTVEGRVRWCWARTPKAEAPV